MKDISRLVSEYRKHVAAHASTHYGVQASVRKGNAAADAMLEIAREVAKAGREAVSQFAALLDEPATGGWAAHHLIEHMDAEPALAQRAVAVIEERSRGDDLTALGERMWLDAWRAKGSAAASRPREA